MSGNYFENFKAREEAKIRCLAQNMRLEDDDFVYNAFGMKVAIYRGVNDQGFYFENLIPETDWDKAKTLKRG